MKFGAVSEIKWDCLAGLADRRVDGRLGLLRCLHHLGNDLDRGPARIMGFIVKCGSGIFGIIDLSSSVTFAARSKHGQHRGWRSRYCVAMFGFMLAQSS
jgi:hypothetical protein